jgi:hypothetical protein
MSVVGTWPREVLANRALPLLALENPLGHKVLCSAARTEIAERALKEGIPFLHPRAARLFATDCAARALEVLPENSPEREQAESVLALLRRFPTEPAENLRRQLASAGHLYGIWQLGSVHGRNGPFYAALDDNPWSAAAVSAEGAAKAMAWRRGAQWLVELYDEEREWQAARLAELLQEQS